MLVKCPSCRGGNLTVHEHFSTASSIHLTGGRIDWTYGSDGQGHSLGKFRGVCDDCGHRWWLKFATGQAVIDAAAEFEPEP